MSGETEKEISGWTVDTYRVHNEAMRLAEEKVETWRHRFAEERDRRYAEVDVEREKALKIKETADLAALGLARDIQDYKDEKANELRAQIEGERGHYTSQVELKSAVEKIEQTIKPLNDYVTAQSGPRAITGTTVAAVLAAGALIIGLYLGLRNQPVTTTPPAQTVTVTTP